MTVITDDRDFYRVQDHGRLTTVCERVVYRHGAILLIVRECSGLFPRRFRPRGS